MTFRTIVMKLSVLKPILVCLGLMLFTTMSGYDAIMSYTVEIFEEAGAGLDPNYSAMLLGGIQVVATIPAAFIVDKSGRRRLLMISEIFMCLSLLAMGTYFFLQRPHICEACSSLSLGWLPLTSLTSFIISYSVGIGPLSLMMIGELLPQHIKGNTDISHIFSHDISKSQANKHFQRHRAGLLHCPHYPLDSGVRSNENI